MACPLTSHQSTPSTALWSDASRMKQYDLIINSCECAEHPEEKTASMLQNHVDYANAGGRVFDTHYNYYWLNHGPAPLPTTAHATITLTVAARSTVAPPPGPAAQAYTIYPAPENIPPALGSSNAGQHGAGEPS